jgi:aquaporin NIP
MLLMHRRVIAELIGTFALVFCGTGAIIINDISGGVITHSGIALSFGLVVLAMIYAIGDISGAHLNPAVTLAFLSSGRMPVTEVLPYMTAQCGGAIAASLALHLLFPFHPTLGTTLPKGSDIQSFVLELILSFLLMFVIFNVATGSKEKGAMAGIAIGAIVALEAMFAGPICGASMNPVRSLGPAVVSGSFRSLWVYLIAPVLGAQMAWGVFLLLSSEADSSATSSL